MSSFTRGHETFWNRSFIAIQNALRLGFISFFAGVTTFIVSLVYYVPQPCWRSSWERLGMAKDRFFNGGYQDIPRLISRSVSSQWDVVDICSEFLIPPLAFGTSIFAIVVTAGYYFFKRRGKNMVEDDHLRGSRLLINAKEYNESVRGNLQQERKEIRSDGGSPPPLKNLIGTPFCPTICGCQIPESFLGRHIAVIGASGTGKSTLLKHKMEHSYEHGRKGIVLDFNGELYSEFGRPNDVILSLYDTRASLWDFSHENVSPDKLASFLVPKTSGGDFWWKGPRRVLSDLLQNNPEAAKLWEIINNDDVEIKDHLMSGLAKRTIGSSAGQASGIEGSLMLDLTFLEHLNHWPNERGLTEKFSVYDWAQNDDPRWVYVIVNDSDSETANPLIQLWFNLAILGLIRRPANNTLPKIAIILDELSSIPKLELLSKVPDLSRKYGGEGFFGFQSPNQILSLYGAKEGAAILSGLQTKFIFNIPGPSDADSLAALLGKQEIKRKSSSLSYSAAALNDRETLGESVTITNVVMGSEIMSLPDGHCYLKSRNLNPILTRIIKKRWKKVWPVYADCARYPESTSKKPKTTEKPASSDLEEESKEHTKDRTFDSSAWKGPSS